MQADFNLQLYKPIQEQSLDNRLQWSEWNYSLFLIFQNADDPTGNDDVSVEYFDGTTWTTIADPPQTDPELWTKDLECGHSYAVALGASADNNPNVKIRFTWINDEGGIGCKSIICCWQYCTDRNTCSRCWFYCKRRCCVQVIALILQIWVTTSLLLGMEFYWRNPATSSVQDPTTVCFLNPGTYTVQLIVSNGTGIDTLTKTDYITVECLYSANRGIQCRTVQISVSVLASISQMKSINGANAWNGYFGRNSEHFNWSESATNLLLHSGIVFRYTNCVQPIWFHDTLVLTDYINVNTCPLPVADFATFTPSFCSNTH